MTVWAFINSSNKIQNVFFAAIIIRLALIVVGIYIDAQPGVDNIKYTDIDYNIYSDAARLVWERKSPYDRATYRYPPLLAIVLVPNVFFCHYGKLLFSLADIGLIYESYCILKMSACPNNKIYWMLMLWAANPLAASICTRGSSDSISNFLIIYTLHAMLMGRFVVSGVTLAVCIHLRMYPVIFVPCVLLHALNRTTPLPHPQTSLPLGGSRMSLLVSQPVVARLWPAIAAAPPRSKSSGHLLADSDNHRESTHRQQQQQQLLSPAPLSSGSKRAEVKAMQYVLDAVNGVLIRWRVAPIKYAQLANAFRFLSAMSLTIVTLTALSYILYGDRYIQEAILYHIRRSDPRHNFSPHFYWMYLTRAASTAEHATRDSSFFTSTSTVNSYSSMVLLMGQDALLQLLKILTFLPQVVLLTLTAFALAKKDLPASFLLSAFIFVAFNKVCTAQYFTWFACFLPIVGGRSHLPTTISSVLAAMWVFSVALWLYNAHQLEFLGVNNFLMVWVCSMIFHVVNVICIAFVIVEVN